MSRTKTRYYQRVERNITNTNTYQHVRFFLPSHLYPVDIKKSHPKYKDLRPNLRHTLGRVGRRGKDNINFLNFCKNLKQLKANVKYKFSNLTSVQSRLVREDCFYSSYFYKELEQDINLKKDGDGNKIDPYILESMYPLIVHDFEEPIQDEWSDLVEYYMKSELRNLTGMSLLEFLDLTPKANSDLRKVVDKVNRERIRAHEQAEKKQEQDIRKHHE